MAKSTTKGRNVKQFPSPDPSGSEPASTSTAVEDPPETSTPFDPPIAPVAPQKPKKTPKVLTFFQRVASIDRADWGTRAKIKVYRLAPLINRLVGTEHKFITIYGEPISEEKVKLDHGSGRYRLYLNYKTAGEKEERELDTVELDILDPMYPPKIPPGEWLEDPRNKEWAWAKPASIPQPGQVQPTTLDPLAAFGTFLDIQDRVQERMTPTAQPAQQAAATVDPWAAAEKILNMRSDNPMVGILQQQQADAAKALEAERERNFKRDEAARQREFELQKQLLEARTNAPVAKGFFEQAVEFFGPAEKGDLMKKVFGSIFGGNSGTGEVVRAGRTTWLDVSRELGSKFLESDLATGVGQYLGALAMKNVNGTPQPMNGNPGTQVQPQNEEAQFQIFIRETLNPALRRFYLQGFDGGDFASWLNDAFPERLKQLQNFTHPMAPGMRGAPVIIGAYKRTPEMWPILKDARPNGEEAFTQFVNEFCQWQPEAQEPIDAEIVPDSEETPERIS